MAGPLSKQVERATYNEKPVLLLKTKDLLEDGKAAAAVWTESGLGEQLLNAVDGDYVKVDGNWTTAAAVARIACDACVLGSAELAVGARLLQSTLQLINRLAPDPYKLMPKAGDKRRCFDHMHSGVKALVKSAPHLRQWLLWCTALRDVLDTLQNVNNAHGEHVQHMQRRLADMAHEAANFNPYTPKVKQRQNSVELLPSMCAVVQPHCKRMAINKDDEQVVRQTASFLCTMLAAHPMELPAFRRKFARLLGSALPQHRLTDRSASNASIEKLLELLDPTSDTSIALERGHQAAARIQAAWRGSRARLALSTRVKGIVLLQRRVRWRRLRAELGRRSAARAQVEGAERTINACALSRRYLNQRLATLAALHPSQVDKFIESEVHHFATVIQSAYRGFSERRRYLRSVGERRRDRAAARIQKAVRRHLSAKRRRAQRLAAWPGLDEAARRAHQLQIDEWCAEAGAAPPPDVDTQRELYTTAQRMLHMHLSNRAEHMDTFQRQLALQARVHLDERTLEEAQSLRRAAATRGVHAMPSGSRAVAAAAAHMHHVHMRRATVPRWQLAIDGDFEPYLHPYDV